MYVWFSFFNTSDTTSLGMITITLGGGALIVSGIARVFAASRGAMARSLISYLLLMGSLSFLLAETGGITSPYAFIWVLTGAFAGLFGIYGTVPVFLLACGYIVYLFLAGAIEPFQAAPTILLGIIPIIFSAIVWSRRSDSLVAEPRERRHEDYRLSSPKIDGLSEEAGVVVNAIGDAVLAVDAKGTIKLMNPAAEDLLGWSPRDASNLDYHSVIKLSDEKDITLSDAADPILATINTNQENRTKHLQLETKSGKKLFVSLVASPLGVPGSGVIIVMSDITKDRLEERQQAEFISTASHEMRTPVASIEGYLGLALNPATATVDEKARDFITKAHEAAQHLGNLFQDLLDVSKADDGRLSNNPTPIDLVAYTKDITEGLRPKATAKGLGLVYMPDPEKAERGERNLRPVFYIKADKDHVREAIANLIENAIKYTPEGQITVDVTGNDKTVTISITDTGIGIPPEDLPHLFQKFYRVDNSDTREIGGTGLGLYLCRRLVETIGGRIWVDSTYKKGSTFYIELPRIDVRTAEALLHEQKAQSIPVPASAPPIPIAAPTITPSPVAPPAPPAPPASPIGLQTPSAVPAPQVMTPSLPAAQAPLVPIPQPPAPASNTPPNALHARPVSVTIPVRSHE